MSGGRDTHKYTKHVKATGRVRVDIFRRWHLRTLYLRHMWEGRRIHWPSFWSHICNRYISMTISICLLTFSLPPAEYGVPTSMESLL